MSNDVDDLQRTAASNTARITVLENRIERAVMIGRVPGVEQ